ncbi:MAG TPA: hypothetical protein DEO84_09360 [candidate division Zixibacteria bacterium]|nr:hypothetical protein [candidate division Zixibacteria bacterium]
MKKFIPVILVLVLAGSAHAIMDISAGIYGGINAPIIQENVKTGTGFGFKAKIAPIPLVAGALFYEARKFGDPKQTVGGITYTGKGGTVNVFGLEALLGSTGGGIGPHFYAMGGISSFKWKRSNQPTFSKTGYNFGAGLEIVLPVGIGVEGQAKFEMVPNGSGASYKSGLVFVGLNYHLGLGVM